MARESLVATAEMCSTSSRRPAATGHPVYYRTSTGGGTTETGTGTATVSDDWLRLARVGNLQWLPQH